MAASKSLRELIEQVPEELEQEVTNFVLFILERHLKAHPEKSTYASVPSGTLAALAQKALEANINTGETDVSRRSREILETEYGDYLAKRLNRSEHDSE